MPDRQSCAFSALSLETSLARVSSPHHRPELRFLPSGKLVQRDLLLGLQSYHLLSLFIGLVKMGCGILVSYHLYKQDTTWKFTKMDGKVNKGMPVFFKEKGFIQKLPTLTRAIKYSIFCNKIQGLPYIFYKGFLYDRLIWKGTPSRP